MADTQKTKRITYKQTRPNPVFQSWLEELYEEAKEKGSRLEAMLKEALESISKYPLPLNSGAECAILKGFDKKLCLFMDKRLEVYNENSRNSLTPLNSSIETQSQENVSNEDNSPPVPPTSSGQKVQKKKQVTTKVAKVPKQTIQKKSYKPTHRSGGYALLVTLLDNLKTNGQKQFLTKEDLIEKAQEHSEESFTRPKPNTHYTAWSNMARLITKGLVVMTRKKKAQYSLTNTGVALATELLEESQNIPTVNDIIFNNTSFSSQSKDNSDNVAMDVSTSANIDTEVSVPKSNATAPVDPKSKTKVPQIAKEPTVVITKEAVQAVTAAQTEDVEMNDSPLEMAADTFDVILLIDKMETSGLSRKNDPTVAQFKKFPDLKHEYRSLKVGDFTWVARSRTDAELEFVLPFIVERKRMDDLGHSIKDGRFHEQKFRLRRCGIKNVIYLVEQYGNNHHCGLPLQSLMQAMCNTRVQDGFRVHMTDSLTHSARFLAMMTKRLTLEYEFKNITLKGRDGEAKPGELMTFSYFNKASLKTRPLTVTETFIKLLLQLKGMSVDKALAITNSYKTPRSLIVKYQKVSNKEGEMLLASLRNSHLSRQVGPVVSKAIYQLFTINNLQ